MYIDESSIDMNIKKDMGWGKKGSLISSTKSGKFYEKTNIVAGLNGSKPIAPMTFHGTCDKALFEAWVEHFLIKELKTRPSCNYG